MSKYVMYEIGIDAKDGDFENYFIVVDLDEIKGKLTLTDLIKHMKDVNQMNHIICTMMQNKFINGEYEIRQRLDDNDFIVGYDSNGVTLYAHPNTIFDDLKLPCFTGDNRQFLYKATGLTSMLWIAGVPDIRPEISLEEQMKALCNPIPIYVVVLVYYDYHRYTDNIFASTNKDECVKFIESINNDTCETKGLCKLPLMEYEANEIQNLPDRYEDNPDLIPAHYWIQRL